MKEALEEEQRRVRELENRLTCQKEVRGLGRRVSSSPDRLEGRGSKSRTPAMVGGARWNFRRLSLGGLSAFGRKHGGLEENPRVVALTTGIKQSSAGLGREVASQSIDMEKLRSSGLQG